MSLRILQVIDTLDPGGAERMAVNITNCLQDEGGEQMLVVTRHHGALADLIKNQQLVVFLQKKGTFDLVTFYNFWKLVAEFKPDLVHAHGPSIYWTVALKALKGKFRLIWHDHLGISEEVIQTNPRKEMRFLAPWIDLILTANENTQEYWVSKRLKKPSQIKYIANFPHLRLGSQPKPEIFTFIHLANFRSEKGQKFLIRSAYQLKEKGLRFRIHLMGKVVDEKWKQECLALIEELGLKDEVMVLPPSPNVGLYLGQAHAGIVASQREGLPVALLEYGLAAIPVISTAVGQCPEVLEQGKYGAVIPFGETERFVTAMEFLVLNTSQAQEIGNEFRNHIQRKYGSQQFIRNYEQLLSTNFGFNLLDC